MLRQYFWLLIIFLFVQANIAFSQTSTNMPPPASRTHFIQPGMIKPDNVLACVKRIQAELRLIQRKENKTTSLRKTLIVSNAVPREVYFQALTLFNKANHLSFEYTQQIKPMLKPITGKIKPSDVWQAVNNALQLILLVKHSLGITQTVPEEPQAKTTTPSDVFNAIVQTNQQINSLLTQTFRPSTVYQQAQRAIGYASILLDQFPGSDVLPEKPPLQPGKRPIDVYRLLLIVFNKIRTIAKLSGVDILSLDETTMQIKEAVPSDVYDMVTLVVSELAYFKNQVDPTEKLPRVYFPGRKTPSQVYQRIGILLKQLDQLETYVKKNPDWLKQRQ